MCRGSHQASFLSSARRLEMVTTPRDFICRQQLIDYVSQENLWSCSTYIEVGLFANNRDILPVRSPRALLGGIDDVISVKTITHPNVPRTDVPDQWTRVNGKATEQAMQQGDIEGINTEMTNSVSTI